MVLKPKINKNKILTPLANYSEKELERELLSRYGDLTEYVIDNSAVIKIFKDLKKVDGYIQYLQSTIAKDILRYFTAVSDLQRENIKGAFARTLYFKNKIMTSEDNMVSKKPSLDLKRYG